MIIGAYGMTQTEPPHPCLYAHKIVDLRCDVSLNVFKDLVFV